MNASHFDFDGISIALCSIMKDFKKIKTSHSISLVVYEMSLIVVDQNTMLNQVPHMRCIFFAKDESLKINIRSVKREKMNIR